MYGQIPTLLGEYKVECNEMMFYQYLPIKMLGVHAPIYEQRLKCFDELIGAICCDFIGTYGLDRFINSYVYVSAKYQFQPKGFSYNRPGWHCDGFMTDDLNYIWSDSYPTIINNSKFNLSMDDSGSIIEMQEQALPENDFTYPNNSLIRLDQFNVHRVADVGKEGMRAFLKVSISKDKYDLIGNAHNYLLDYNWQMKQRKVERNMPQTK